MKVIRNISCNSISS